MWRRAALAVGMVMAAGSALAQDAATGEATFQRYCAVCHGIEASGQGPMAPVLTIQPTDLTGLAATNGGVFPMQRAAARIDGRDPLVAHGSPMPVYGEFFDGAQVAMALPDGQPMLVSRRVADVLAYLASIQRAE